MSPITACMAPFLIQHSLYQQHIIVYLTDYAMHEKGVKEVCLVNKSKPKC